MDLLQRVQVLNNKSKKLNEDRQRNLGKVETLKRQLDEQVEKYKEAYGVHLTPQNIDSEIQMVHDEVKQEADRIDAIITAIEVGDYKLAEELSGAKVEGVHTAEPKVEAEGTPFVKEEPVSVEKPATVEEHILEKPPVMEEPVLEKPPAMEEPVHQGLEPSAGVFARSFTASEPDTVADDVEDVFLSGLNAAPKNVASTTEEKSDDVDDVPPPPSFANVLAGSNFGV